MEGQALGLLLLFTSVLWPDNAATLENGIDIYSLRVDCKVTSRFARSTITSKVVNRANESKEATFEVELPKTAFITNFTMTIDGVDYPGTIKEKAAAQEQYDRAISQGQSAGLVKATGRMMETFEVSVNVAAAGKVTFELVYEELLKRKLGNYQLLIKVKPKQLVKHFQIDVHIFEPQGIRFLETSSTFMTNELSEALSKTITETKAHVSFNPTIDQQRKNPGLEVSLLDGDLMINYDVRRSSSSGDVQIINGYFVHYFAPAQMPALSKNVVFVIDTSGSMRGRKIVQTREALLKILEDISSDDFFNLVTFSSSVSRWKDSMVKATVGNVSEAENFVKSIRDGGATNINDALLTAVTILKQSEESEVLPERSVSMIILLTDGQPNTGESNIEQIQLNVKRSIMDKYTLYCLGFGFDVDYKFLEKMALENGGLARRIYEDSDSALQLQGFYKEVANPILKKIQLEYPDNSISQLTETNFRQLFDGSEIVVAGKIDDNELNHFIAEIKAQTHTADLVYKVEENIAEKEEALKQSQYVFGDFVERLWAYLTIQQLLEKVILATGDVQKDLQKKALELSLKYSFVTSLTSMVVTKPEDQDNPIVANKPTEERQSEDLGAKQSSRSHKKMSARNPLLLGYGGNGQHLSKQFLLSRVISGERLSSANPIDKDTHVRNTAKQHPYIRDTHVRNTAKQHPYIRDQYTDFLVQLPNQGDPICISVSGEPKDTIDLIADPDTGVWVNGTKMHRAKYNYFESFDITYKDPDVTISVSRSKITIQSVNVNTTMSWFETSPVKIDSMQISISKRILSITTDGKASFIIYYPGSPKRFLQLKLTGVHHFSNKVSGKLGQFYFNSTFDASADDRQTAHETLLTVQGKKMQATRILKKIYNTNAERADTITCWLVNLKHD
ncbi:inter-alpha-trypsin inhibitor heavy chain H4-like isoform X3 [Ambystoma mexicanum]|uniref:inter-alpha-trypsin inhibitor heavy chain H4-like isoform X3 n=1 Tax=Ambystoma mexicanum TaxID=8296 RepID=UPI0037E92CFA